MKKILLLGIVLLNALFVSAQEYHIKKEKNKLFIVHNVKAKETLYSLGRLYNLSHKDIAAANKLDANTGLKLGQQVKIPLGKSNFLQAGQKKKGYEPVYHTIAKGDNLYKVSRNYNNVKEEQLKKWNKLSKNIVKSGQEIIVGYLKVSDTNPGEKEEVVAIAPPKNIDTSKTSKTTANPEPVVTTAVRENKATTEHKEDPVVFTGNSEDAEGFFAGQFAVSNATAQPRTVTGMAATFKSTSGWSDRKYYILINDIPAGTILKVNANNKTIYAKVLEGLPELKDNRDLLCRLSNAGASALGITDTKFSVELYYSE
jgi:LysM repeat protein